MITKFFVMAIFFCMPFAGFAMDSDKQSYTENVVEQLSQPLSQLSLNEYDSDSEDEADYAHSFSRCSYPEIRANTDDFPVDQSGKRPVQIFLRGISCDPSFTKLQRSAIRRRKAGEPIFSWQSYEIAGVNVGQENESGNCDLLEGVSDQVRDLWDKTVCRGESDSIVQAYVNTGQPAEPFSKIPFISTSDCQAIDCKTKNYHVLKYAFGNIKSTTAAHKEHAGEEFDTTDIYDLTGRPKHPYVGMIEVIMVAQNELESDPNNPVYVLCEQRDGNIKASWLHLYHRIVSFIGSIPGKNVVCLIPIRWPSFVAGSYQPYHGKKHNLNVFNYTFYKRVLARPENDPERIKTIIELRDKLYKHTHDRISATIKKINAMRDGQGRPVYKLVAKDADGRFVKEGLQATVTTMKKRKREEAAES